MPLKYHRWHQYPILVHYAIPISTNADSLAHNTALSFPHLTTVIAATLIKETPSFASAVELSGPNKLSVLQCLQHLMVALIKNVQECMIFPSDSLSPSANIFYSSRILVCTICWSSSECLVTRGKQKIQLHNCVATPVLAQHMPESLLDNAL